MASPNFAPWRLYLGLTDRKKPKISFGSFIHFSLSLSLSLVKEPSTAARLRPHLRSICVGGSSIRERKKKAADLNKSFSVIACCNQASVNWGENTLHFPSKYNLQEIMKAKVTVGGYFMLEYISTAVWSIGKESRILWPLDTFDLKCPWVRFYGL